MINLYVGNIYTIILFINNQKIDKWSLANFVSVTLANLVVEFYIFEFNLKFISNLRNWIYFQPRHYAGTKKWNPRNFIFFKIFLSPSPGPRVAPYS